MSMFTMDNIGDDYIYADDIREYYYLLQKELEEQEEQSVLPVERMARIRGDLEVLHEALELIGQHAVKLIRGDEFKTYAQDLAYEVGLIPMDVQWPCTHIDWDQAAKELSYDYSVVDIGGYEYFFRD